MNNIKPKEQKAINQAHAFIQQNNAMAARDTLLDYSKNNKLSQPGLYWLCISYGLSGNPAKAKTIALNLIKNEPGNIEYTKLLGNCCHELKEYDEAINQFRKALKFNQNDFLSMANLASALKEANQLDEAESLYIKSLGLAPNQPNAITNLGILMQTKGELDKAIELHNKALLISPNNPTVLYNLARVTREKGNKEQALKLYLSAIASSPTHVNALCEAGILYTELLQPQKALELFQQALIYAPDNEATHLGLGLAYKTLNRLTEAKESIQQAIKINPENDTAKYMLSAIDGNSTVTKSPDKYVQELFDTYAEAFDSHLTKQLEYRTPELINSKLRKIISNSDKYNILDLGCGTGLAGTYLTDIALTMTGVDLSPKMIKKAEARNIYTTLVVDGIEQFLETSELNPDIVISADVFVYIGELNNIFAYISKRITKNGYFVFSTESTNDIDTFRLRDSGRFAHNPAYIQNLSRTSGFTIIDIEEAVIRHEAGKPMHGHIYLLKY
jgi:predicted TPR repeat methyltransferase